MITPFSGRGRVESCEVAWRASREVGFNGSLRSVLETGHRGCLLDTQVTGKAPPSCHSSLPPLLRPHGRALSTFTFPTVRLLALGSWSCAFGPNQSPVCFSTAKARRPCPRQPPFCRTWPAQLSCGVRHPRSGRRERCSLEKTDLRGLSQQKRGPRGRLASSLLSSAILRMAHPWQNVSWN